MLYNIYELFRQGITMLASVAGIFLILIVAFTIILTVLVVGAIYIKLMKTLIKKLVSLYKNKKNTKPLVIKQ